MKILVLGAGRMGSVVAYDLLRSPGVRGVVLADARREALRAVQQRLRNARLRVQRLEAEDSRGVLAALRAADAAVCALPYRYNEALTRIAIEAGTHLCDLGGSHELVARQQRLDPAARRCGVTILPDCGLAPGLTSVIVAHGVRLFRRVARVAIYTGGLPQQPRPPLNYQLFFSPEGLINEYAEPVRVLRAGRLVEVEPLSEVEEIHFRGFGPLEAFNTSGGSSTLVETYRGRVRDLTEKTIRYPGHCAQLQALRALGFFSSAPIKLNGQRIVPRRVLETLLERTIGNEVPDVLFLRVVLWGQTQRGRRCVVYELIDRYDWRHKMTAMMRTTAFPASIAAQWLAQGKLPAGVQRPEVALPAEAFLQELAWRGLRVRRRWQRGEW